MDLRKGAIAGWNLQKKIGKMISPMLSPGNEPYMMKKITTFVQNFFDPAYPDDVTQGRIREMYSLFVCETQLSINLFQARSNASVRLYPCVSM